MRTLLVGVPPGTEALLGEAIGLVDPNGKMARAATFGDALAFLRTHEANCIVLASEALPPSGWDAVGAELRRAAPQAALVAVPRPGEALGEAWDGVVEERDPRVLPHVLRGAFAVARAHARLARLALHDPLTDLLNRRGLEAALHREASRADRGQGPLSALLVDCDDFKRVNDESGLPAGDEVLRGVARALVESVRAGDVVARIGGDEFVVLLPQTRTWEAVEVAERIRTRVRDRVKPPGGRVQTVSIGVRRLDRPVTTVEELVGAAEQGLKASKAVGKDQVRVVDSRPPAAGAPPGKGVPVRPRADVSLPPTSHAFAHRRSVVVDLATRAPALVLLEPQLREDEELESAANRAMQSNFDLAWFRAALADERAAGLPVHTKLYPGTILDTPSRTVLSLVPAALPPALLTFVLDEQFLSGDPTALRPKLSEYGAKHVSWCVYTSDLGRTAYEGLVILRPARMWLAPELTAGVANSRGRRATLSRFVAACTSLGIAVVATGIGLAADANALAEVGVRYGAGPALTL